MRILLGHWKLSILKRYLYREVQPYGKKVTTTLLYNDENVLWSEFYYNQSRHGNVMTLFHFLFIFVFLCTRSFFKKLLKEVCTYHYCLNYGKVWKILWERFGNILKQSFKNHKNSEIALFYKLHNPEINCQ